METVEEIVNKIEQELLNSGNKEVESELIGELVMNHLQKANLVACDRFASVYRDFKDVETFRKEIDSLLKIKKITIVALRAAIQQLGRHMLVNKDINGKRYLYSEDLIKFGKLKHLFSTRDYGNLGLHVPGLKRDVLQNRKEVCEAIAIDSSHLTSAKQVHGINIKMVVLEDRGRGSMDFEASIADCDGLITNIPNIPLFAFYADCTPIFIYDPDNEVIGILHAGWKGTLGNIAGKSVDILIELFNSKPEKLIYVIGPRIGMDNCEVGEDIILRCEELGMKKEPFVSNSKINLGEINKELLKRKGVKNIDLDQHCTCADDMFFSYRCEKGKTGRMAGIIMLAKEVKNE